MILRDTMQKILVAVGAALAIGTMTWLATVGTTAAVAKGDERWHRLQAFNEYVTEQTVVGLESALRDARTELRNLETDIKFEADANKRGRLEERAMTKALEIQEIEEQIRKRMVEKTL